MTRESSFGRGSVRASLRLAFVLTVMGLSASQSGCGHTLYVFQANSAASRLEEARELGAEKLRAVRVLLRAAAPGEGARRSGIR